METNFQEIISEQTKTLADFRQYLLDDGKAGRTVQSYVADVAHFLSHVTEVNPKPLSDLTRQDVTRFRSHMVEKAFKPATMNKAVNSLSCFCQWLQATRIHREGQKLVDPKRDRVKVAAGSEGEVSVRGGKAFLRLALPPGSYPHTILTQLNRTIKLVLKESPSLSEALSSRFRGQKGSYPRLCSGKVSVVLSIPKKSEPAFNAGSLFVYM